MYLSLYLRENRSDDARQRARTLGDREGWLRFYLIGLEVVATQAADTVAALTALSKEVRARIQGQGPAAGCAHRMYDVLRRRIVVSIPGVATEADMTRSPSSTCPLVGTGSRG